MRELPYSMRERLASSGVSGTGRAGAALVRSAAIGLAAAIFLTLSGAFGADGEPFGLRLLYWLILLIVGSLASTAAIRILRQCRPLAGRPFLLWALATLSLTPLSAMVWGLNGLMFGYWFEGAGLLVLMPNILLVAAAITALNLLGDRRTTPVLPIGAASEPLPRPAFAQRLPFKLRAASIRALQAEDHYLRVYTDAGDALILVQLTKAVAELAGVEGARIHRSWWVARSAVIGARRYNGRTVLELAGGLEAPVSRTVARTLREQGWF